ncbi:MAG: hypothetical protein HKO66_02755 [Saprospiraceae bacterium]|nr:hypothetical protein [Bacteroidia bacterium]NNE14597.1 hypothetical protein [Saprospiraceae bacterium]NNL91134.1 hypothetical protein [Saprospiraceae bacterium]
MFLVLLNMLVFFSFIIISSCSNDEPIAEEECTVSFKNEIRPIFESACSISGCHVSGFQSGDFSSFDTIRSYALDGRIWFRVGVTRTMPPLNELLEEDINKIQSWINEGAKNN